ncbi:MAG: UbiA family prenyltransferase, partial [Bacteroidia bacterium]|nr:UbiA family prenyltransferase [Bacteroidia bacterium]
MLTLLSSLRPVNLLLVILSQLTFYFLVITPSLQNDLRLNNGGLLYLFVICTVLITASGYLVNDYFDFENDDINNKNKGFKEKHSLLILYYSLSLAGFFIALYIAYSIGNPLLSLIYAAATLLLYLYSSHLKSTVLLGNILVSLFTTMVFMILIVAEWPALEIQKLKNLNAYNNLIGMFIFFGLFAFCISMVREIVKDIEDSHGDTISGVHTLPVAWGVEKAKIVAAFFGF